LRWIEERIGLAGFGGLLALLARTVGGEPTLRRGLCHRVTVFSYTRRARGKSVKERKRTCKKLKARQPDKRVWGGSWAVGITPTIGRMSSFSRSNLSWMRSSSLAEAIAIASARSKSAPNAAATLFVRELETGRVGR